ncbi:UNVERIFIED_CONTAM: Zinc finger protein CONSTANS-LIKE 1 [Sesamum calycinum]|uniref:Zinc finger protein CONSTANS-LIKE 1 n=1 Tax=Sesamum calycinum TaxID=2727403 RepID=A0AAW2MCZ1_9LAMI
MSASIPRSDYTFPPEFPGLPIPATFSDPTIEQTLNMFNNNTMTTAPAFMTSDIHSPVSVASFPDQFGVPDCGSLAALSMGFYDVAGCSYRNQPGEDCSGLMAAAESWPPNYDMVADNIWVVQGAQESKQVGKVEDSEVKVGRYSVEERKHRILRYLKKRNQRNFNKTIKYACRKTLADKRVRIRGRFAKNNEPCEEDIHHHNYSVINTSDNSYQQNDSSFYVDDESSQIMYGDDDDWLQAAMGGLVYLPYIAG